MRKIVIGLLIATSLVAVSACNKTESADNMAAANAMQENVDVMADNMVANDMMMANDSSAMDSNADAMGDSLDNHGSSGGH